MFGDPLLDLVQFVFWFPLALRKQIIEEYQKFMDNTSKKVENFNERVECYFYYKGLDALRYFAKTDNEEKYEAVLNNLKII